MDKIADWIKTWGVIIGLFVGIGTFSYQSCATRRDIERLESKIDKVADEARTHRYRIEDKLEQLNQNYINHLAHHNKKD